MKKIKKVQIGNAMLYCADCFDVLPKLDITVDAVISDPPFSCTACKWDVKIDLTRLWEMLDRVTKPTANFVMFGCGKFSINLINSKYRWYRHDLIWAKNNKVGFLNANLQTMRNHESILIFGRPGFCKRATYNAQKIPGGRASGVKTVNHRSSVYRDHGEYVHTADGTLHPGSVLSFKSEKNSGLHPTLKPVALMEWLVKTYANDGETVIDPFMGSGTTAVACVNTGRAFVGVEQDTRYFAIAVERVKKAQDELLLRAC